MKWDEYDGLFDSIKIKDEIYDRMVESAVRKFSKKRHCKTPWLYYAAAAIPVLAVAVLVILIRMPWLQKQNGPAAVWTETELAETEITAEEAAVTSDVIAFSGIVPEMSVKQKKLTKIAAELYFEQREKLRTFFFSNGITDNEFINNVVTYMGQKPNYFYDLVYDHPPGRTWEYAEVINDDWLLADEYELSLFLNEPEDPCFTYLVDALENSNDSLQDNPPHNMESQTYRLILRRSFVEARTEGLTDNEVIIIECTFGGFFFCEFCPSGENSMLVSSGYCSLGIQEECFENMNENGLAKLDRLGYTAECFNYYDFRWGEVTAAGEETTGVGMTGTAAETTAAPVSLPSGE